MKYILEYIKEELFIEPVAGSMIDLEEEFADADTPIGYRLIINGKDVDIVVWYADYAKWLEKQYVNKQYVNLCADLLEVSKAEPSLLDLMTEEERKQYHKFCQDHTGCKYTSTIGGKISVEVTGTGLGYCFKCKCNACGETKDLIDNNW